MIISTNPAGKSDSPENPDADDLLDDLQRAGQPTRSASFSLHNCYIEMFSAGSYWKHYNFNKLSLYVQVLGRVQFSSLFQ